MATDLPSIEEINQALEGGVEGTPVTGDHRKGSSSRPKAHPSNPTMR